MVGVDGERVLNESDTTALSGRAVKKKSDERWFAFTRCSSLTNRFGISLEIGQDALN